MEEQNLSKFPIFNLDLLIQHWLNNFQDLLNLNNIFLKKKTFIMNTTKWLDNYSNSITGRREGTGLKTKKKTIRLVLIDPTQESNLRSLCIFRANTNSKYRVWKDETFPPVKHPNIPLSSGWKHMNIDGREDLEWRNSIFKFSGLCRWRKSDGQYEFPPLSPFYPRCFNSYKDKYSTQVFFFTPGGTTRSNMKTVTMKGVTSWKKR